MIDSQPSQPSLSRVPGGAVFGRLGALEVRLAGDEEEIAAAQEMRHAVFFGNRHGDGTPARDVDRFDAVCDHLIVFDRSLPGEARSQIVGTYRLLPQARASGGFYTAGEFDIASLIARHPGRNFLELGRSCVRPEWRTKRTIELLWQGIWAYCRRHRIDVMTGCASFPGTVPAAHAQALSYLFHHHRARGDWAASALPGRRQPMDLMPVEAVDPRAALAELPPLIKGYLRVGAMIGDGAVIDDEFGSVDVLVVLPVEVIAGRYLSHYDAAVDRFAA